jgi:hypothetical protein
MKIYGLWTVLLTEYLLYMTECRHIDWCEESIHCLLVYFHDFESNNRSQRKAKQSCYRGLKDDQNKDNIFPWKAKAAHGILTILTLEMDILRKVIIPFDSAWNSLSHCVFWLYLGLSSEKWIKWNEGTLMSRFPQTWFCHCYQNYFFKCFITIEFPFRKSNYIFW